MIKMQFSKVAMRLPQKGENQWVLFKKKFFNPKAFFYTQRVIESKDMLM